MDPVAVFTQACDLTQRQVDAAMQVPDKQTGCAEWNATQLVNHMVVTLGMWADITTGQTPQHDPFDPPHILGDDMAADFRAAAARTQAAFAADGFMEQTFQTPAGELPGAAVINFPTYDVYVHGWDLEQATGVAGEYPEHLTALAMGFAQQAFTEGRPPHVVGPAIAIDSSASALDQMLAFNGRRP